jgi:hypothetical protein
MCLVMVSSIQFDKLTEPQKTRLKKKLEQHRKTIQKRLDQVNQALKVMEKKSKR